MKQLTWGELKKQIKYAKVSDDTIILVPNWEWPGYMARRLITEHGKDWGPDFIIEGGWVEDYRTCYNL